VARRVCDLENLVNEEAIARVWLQRHMEKELFPFQCFNVMGIRGIVKKYKVSNLS
jgi:hypothetical protein